MLKICAPNSRFPPSPMKPRCVSLLIVKSTLSSPGPRSRPRDASPIVPYVVLAVQVDEVQTAPPGALTIGCIVNIFGLYHCVGLCWMTVLLLNGTGVYLQELGFALQLATSALVAMLARSTWVLIIWD